MTSTDPIFALSYAVVIAAIYLVVLRLVDINEKEPVWALTVALAFGAVAGVLADAFVDVRFRELSLLGVAVTADVGKFIAITFTVAVLEGVSRARGWSEISGVVDGLVYGAAVGLGFATGEAFFRELIFGAAPAAEAAGTFTALWTTALAGLSEGLFGAVIGAGFGAALVSRRGALAAVLPVASLIVAIVLHVGYTALAVGEPGRLQGRSLVWPWIALLLPLAIFIGAIVWGLAQERRAIAEELAEETESGTVTEDELRLLKSPAARRAAYARRLLRLDLDGWLALRSLQNSQVQLALAKRRTRRHGEHVEGQEPVLRSVIVARRQRLAQVSNGAATPHGVT